MNIPSKPMLAGSLELLPYCSYSFNLRFRTLLYLFWVTATLLLSWVNLSAQLTYSPSDDAAVKTGFADLYGDQEYLRIREYTEPSTKFYSFLKFTVPDTGESFQSVTLKLTTRLTPIQTVSLYRVTSNNWNEGTVNGLNSPALGDLITTRTYLNDIFRQYEFDVSSYITGPGTWTIALASEQRSSGLDFYSKERSGTAQDPVLEVQYGAVEQMESYYVSPDGDDTNNGRSVESPFRTIARAIAALQPGDLCFLRGGTYRETLDLSSLEGLSSERITIRNYPGEVPVIDGRTVLSGTWTLHQGSLYKMNIGEDIWQLFSEDEPLTLARFPNVKTWSKECWQVHHSRAFFSLAQESGGIGTLTEEDGQGFRGIERLSDLTVDLDGCVAVMNLGQWINDHAYITDHQPGGNTFRYAADASTKLYQTYPYYFIEGLAVLDTPGEWWYDKPSSTLYYWPEDGANPTGTPIYGKERAYGLQFTSGAANSNREEARFVTIDGLHFFACGFYLYDNESITVQNCTFDYPAAPRRVLSELYTYEDGQSANHPVSEAGLYSRYAENFIFRNNVIRRSELMWEGRQMINPLIENNLFKEFCPAAGNYYEGNSVIRLNSSELVTLRRNTFDTFGNANGIAHGHQREYDDNETIIEYNRFENSSLLQGDAMCIQLNFNAYDSILRYNWFLDANKGSFRWDTPVGNNEGNLQDFGICYRNVTFGGPDGEAKIKGDHHEVYHNTGKIILRNDAVSNGTFNDSSVSKNNAVVDAYAWNADINTGTYSNNWREDIAADQFLSEQMVAPHFRDFRPVATSAWVDSGTLVSSLTINEYVPVNGIREGTPYNPGDLNYEIVNGVPDIGAYEYGASNYWIPGRKEAKASVPIPYDGAVDVPDRELIWLSGYQSTSSNLYFGSDPTAVLLASIDSPEYKGNFPDGNNRYNPNDSGGHGAWYWRVDSIDGAGTIVTGDVWGYVRKDSARSNVSISLDPVEVGYSSLESGTSQTDGSLLMLRKYDASNAAISFLQFDLGDLDGGHVLSATLKLTAASTIPDAAVVDVPVDQWTAQALTSTNFPSFARISAWNKRPLKTAEVTNLATGETVSFDVSSIVTGGGLHSFALVTDTNQSGLAFKGVQSDAPPLLEIVYSTISDAGDIDQDGMSDHWELEHYNNIENSDTGADEDGDGFTRLEESLAGTDPFDPISALWLSLSPRDGTPTDWELSWPSVRGKHYNLYFSNNLIQWELLEPQLKATPPNNSTVLSSDSATVFFRLAID